MTKPILLTGIKKKGITLVELSCAIAILSFGIIVAFKGLVSSLSALDESKYRLMCLSFINTKIMDVKRSVRSGMVFNNDVSRGTFDMDGKTFNYMVSISTSSVKENLFRGDVICYWRRGSRRIEVSRSFLCGKGDGI